jgi:hypothetical protein
VSASTLRAAAALIRERARAIPSDPDEEPWFRFPLDGIAAAPWTHFTRSFPAEAELVASWPPAVALAVADLIDTILKVGPVDGGAEWDATVTLARTYLGSDA